MTEELFHLYGSVDLVNGEKYKEFSFSGVAGKLITIEFVGVNAFAQPGQVLFVTLQVHTNSDKGTYPIVLTGISSFEDTTYPTRIFGSQQVRLYADPNSPIIIGVERNNGSKEARAFFDISGIITVP